MKSPEETLAEIASHIIHVRWKPHLHVGNLADPGSANALYCEMHLAIQLWLWIQEREYELRDARQTAMRGLGISGAIPPHVEAAFRQLPNDECCHFVLQFWDEVAKQIGLDISEVTWDRIKPTPLS